MKRAALLLPLLLLAGCANAPLLGNLGLVGAGARPRIVCALNGRAELLQEGVAGLATSTALKDADALCAALKRPVAASAPGA